MPPLPLGPGIGFSSSILVTKMQLSPLTSPKIVAFRYAFLVLELVSGVVLVSELSGSLPPVSTFVSWLLSVMFLADSFGSCWSIPKPDSDVTTSEFCACAISTLLVTSATTFWFVYKLGVGAVVDGFTSTGC